MSEHVKDAPMTATEVEERQRQLGEKAREAMHEFIAPFLKNIIKLIEETQ